MRPRRPAQTKVMNTLATVICIILIIATCAFGKGWRGIVPLHSNRSDVERLLGPSAEPSNIYKLKDMVVVVDYTDGPCEKCWPFAGMFHAARL